MTGLGLNLNVALLNTILANLGIDPKHAAADLAGPELKKLMLSHLDTMASGLRQSQERVQDEGIEHAIHDALFRVWRSVCFSGDLADLIRDAQNAKVIATVTPLLTVKSTPKEVLTAVINAAIDLAF